MILLTDGDVERLKELAAESEKPENHIKMENMALMATAFDAERFTRVVGLLDPVKGPYPVKVAFSITEGEKATMVKGGEVGPPKRTLFRHASIRMHDSGDVVLLGEQRGVVLVLILPALGFRNDGPEVFCEAHPGLPGVFAYFQEFKSN